MDSILKELEQRKRENENLQIAVEEEKRRIEEKQRKARERNPLRRIKIVDSISLKSEIKKKEKALQEFEAKEEAIIATIRKERSKQIARKHSGLIAIVAIGLIAVIVAGTFISRAITNKRILDQYNAAVDAIESEDYTLAISTLSGISIYDSETLLRYAQILSDVESYKEKPSELVEDLEQVGEFDSRNDAIKMQYNSICEQASIIKTLLFEIDRINNKDVYLDSKNKLDEIGSLLLLLDERFADYIDVSKYEKAMETISIIENETPAGKVIKEIHELDSVTLESGEILSAIRSDYYALSLKERELVVNIDYLQDAEKKYSDLVAKKEAEEKAELEAEKERERKRTIREALDKSVEAGFSDLQALYILVDETYSIDELQVLAKELGFVTNLQEDAGTDGMYLEVATENGWMGNGAEIWFDYDVDHATFMFSGRGNVYSKTYCVIDTEVTVYYDFYDKQIAVVNDIAGHFARNYYERTTNYETIEEALTYAMNYKD